MGGGFAMIFACSWSYESFVSSSRAGDGARLSFTACLQTRRDVCYCLSDCCRTVVWREICVEGRGSRVSEWVIVLIDRNDKYKQI